MALTQPAHLQDRRPSPNLTLNLPSNNPFRNRAASPSSASPAIPSPISVQSAPGERPVSRNPFLAAYEDDKSPAENPRPDFSRLNNMASEQKRSPQKATFGPSAQELFDNLNLNDKSDKERPKPGPNARPPHPMRIGSVPNQGHRPSRSAEDDKRAHSGSRRPPRPRGPPGELNIFDSPEKGENRHRRRNSDTSVSDKPKLTEEERKRTERRRDGGRRDKDGKPRSSRPHRPRGLDLIDKLDVTGMYGSGLFHHDGPFDACNPHRNRRKDHRAPMQAFPANSANNAIGGSGPVNKNIDLERFHGRGAEGFTDYNRTMEPPAEIKRRPSGERGFNPIERVEPVHGEESIGLGTSTFLEGTQASRTAIQRRQSETETATVQGADGGIQRKKSLAQRIRGMSQPRPRFAENGTGPRIRTTRGPLSPETPRSGGSPMVQSAGGLPSERNPFFEDYDEAYDKKGASIKVAEGGAVTSPGAPAQTPAVEKPGTPTTARPPAPDSPMRGGRGESAIADDVATSPGAENPPKSGGGFLSRVKSLKGGKKQRPERRGS